MSTCIKPITKQKDNKLEIWKHSRAAIKKTESFAQAIASTKKAANNN